MKSEAFLHGIAWLPFAFFQADIKYIMNWNAKKFSVSFQRHKIEMNKPKEIEIDNQ